MKNTQPTVIITGASGGYGAGIAETFTQRGYRVWITARNGKKLEEVASRIGATAIVADATNSADWDRVIKTVLDAAAVAQGGLRAGSGLDPVAARGRPSRGS